MSHSTRSVSPDPITLPSSPLGARSGNARQRRRQSTKSIAPHSNNAHHSSPSKSFIMETGQAGDASPWRIKVTVEAEPQESNSPTRKVARTTKVPLKGTGSRSPAKRTNTRQGTSEKGLQKDGESERPQRKRKGTPIRRRPARTMPPCGEDDADAAEDPAVSNSLFEHLASNKNSAPLREPTERSKRLNKAREELNSALQDAIGPGNDENVDPDAALEDSGEATIANEDFTMVSVETLQSMKQNTSQLLDNSDLNAGDKSVASVSYMPSSPPPSHHEDSPGVQYPDITTQASAAKQQHGADELGVADVVSSSSDRHYDAMSWIPTGPLISSHGASSNGRSQKCIEPHLSSGSAVGIEETTARDAVVIVDHAKIDKDGQRDEGDDIWAEEASRSFEEAQEESRVSNGSTQLREIFGAAPQPPRPKIPRTWRRSSGIEFSYSDSPEYGALRRAPERATDTEGAESRSDGVLTPPSTDDETGECRNGADRATEESDTSFTKPDAESTALHAEHPHGRSSQDRGMSPVSDSSSSATSPDGEGNDTGMFWQTNLPNVYPKHTRPRFQRQERAMDLSELLNLNKSPTPAKVRPSVEHNDPHEVSTHVTNRGNMHAQARASRAKPSFPTKFDEKVMSSPLRRSLLKSSKIGGSRLPSTGHPTTITTSLHAERNAIVDSGEHSSFSESQSVDDSTSNSFQSQDSVQRQLLGEMRTASANPRASTERNHSSTEANDGYGVSYDEPTRSEYQSMETEEDQSQTRPSEWSFSEGSKDEPTCSYEEHLNLDSPQKITVNFNDSDPRSSLLVPRKHYPPIFGTDRSAADAQDECTAKSPPSVTLVAKQRAQSSTMSNAGIFSRLSTTFWSAVIRPSGSAEIRPGEEVGEPDYCPILRRHIRSRYGVLSEQHPWTMAHMRTLHRMLNSCTGGKADSIVPKAGPLPLELENAVDKHLISATPHFSWTFTRPQAHVVDTFMQTLVPEHIVQAIKDGEMEFLGDSNAKIHRGVFGERHGDMVVFEGIEGVKEPKGRIETAWVVKALGNCVSANVLMAEKDEER